MNKIEFAEKIAALYVEKKWYIEDFDAIVGSIIQKYSPDELDFIYFLLKRFEKIPMQGYIGKIVGVLSGIPSLWLQGITKVYLYPLLPLSESKKTKSSFLMCAIMSYSPQITNHAFFSNVRLQLLEKEDLKNSAKKINAQNSLLLLVDDFIGSGETALNCIKDLWSTYNIARGRMLVFSIASSQVGYEKIRKVGVKVACGYVQKKGISQISDLLKKQEYTDMMKNIEQNIDVDPEYNFGYGQCESLISMERTPNNTFPFFWLKNEKNRPLFKREKKKC